ncbi:uncharacterized protein [Miscanthus floridulus]|uniref:uncharacterized protein n=1 Tax=Miscanthus floridulus TaxID=154761 RepID=UPI0034599B10
MTVEHSNKKQAMHPPTMFCSYLTFVSGLSLRSLVADEFLSATPIWCRYIAIKALVHASALFLVSLSLMMRMNVVDREDGASRAARDAGAVARLKSRVRRACIGSHGGARPRARRTPAMVVVFGWAITRRAARELIEDIVKEQVAQPVPQSTATRRYRDCDCEPCSTTPRSCWSPPRPASPRRPPAGASA